jgi:phosphoribosylformylglycinamidine (FGAM) synthase-like enzyme
MSSVRDACHWWERKFGGTEYQATIHGVTEGRPPVIDLEVEKNVQQALLKAIQSGLVCSAHDLSEGGLGIALAEACISGGIGAAISVDSQLRADAVLFSESQSRILVSTTAEQASAFEKQLSDAGVLATKLGQVGGTTLSVSINGTSRIDAQVNKLEQIWKDAIPCRMA